jgi:hypothetical protein
MTISGMSRASRVQDGEMNKLIASGAAAYAGLGVVSFLKPAMVPATRTR